MHHGFTNLKGRDNVWIRIAVEEWRALTPGRCRLERFYRSLPGLGFYYLIEIWWRKLIAADRANRIAWRREHLADRLLVAAFAVGAITGIAALSQGAGRTAVNVVCTIVVPLLVWGGLIGFTTHVQHPHPTVNWHRNKEDWLFQAGQLESSIHVRFPGLWNRVLHNIYEDTAHHVNMRIPFYELPEAQSALETAAGDSIPIIEWKTSEFIRSLQVCQLYDYVKMRWVVFPCADQRHRRPSRANLTPLDKGEPPPTDLYATRAMAPNGVGRSWQIRNGRSPPGIRPPTPQESYWRLADESKSGPQCQRARSQG